MLCFPTLLWCQDNAYPVHQIAVNDLDQWSDLAALGASLEGRSRVLLGEFSHGSGEVNLLKNRLIRYLHEEHGFEVLLFESGVGELIAFDLLRHRLSARSMLGGLIGPWHTREYVDYTLRDGSFMGRFFEKY